MRYIILLMTIFIFISANDYKKVLFISSYDLSFPTVKKQIQGIQQVLDEKSYQLDIEFMDTKRLNPREVELTFFQLLNIKQEILKTYDAILLGDDNALHFIKNYQNAFFFKKPIIFLAVNDVSFAHEISKNDYITGVIEKQSINETINLIEKLHPKETKITAIVDNTTTSKAIVSSFDKKILERVEFLNVSDYSFDELEVILKRIPVNKPLVYISALFDKNLNKKEFYQSIEYINDFTQSPIYHFYEHGIGKGLIGGKVVTFIDQGRKAATILDNVLKGENIHDIKPTSTENKYIFDYEELEKFDLIDKVPKDSILINKPQSFLDQPLEDIFLQIIVLIVIVLVWIGYLLYKLSRSSVVLKQKTIEQSDLLSLFDIGDTVLFKWKNDESWSISHVSKNIKNLLGYTKKEFLNAEVSYSSCIHPDDIEKVSEEVQKAKENEEQFFRHEPYRLITKDNKIKWVIDYTVLLRNEDNEITHFLGYLLDISKEKNIQNTLEKLIDSQNSIIFLSNGKNLTFANKKFYEFFKCNSIKDFEDKFHSLRNLFVENDRFFHLGKINKDDLWMEKIQEFPKSERIVALTDSRLNVCAFSVNSNKFDDNLYLVSLTDISETVIEQIKLEEKTIHDKLTGAYNREYFENNYKLMINECEKTGKQLAIAILDIDYFKKINDTYGHDIGDYVLKELVNRINKVTREDDILIRWGGEEFILVLKVKSSDDLLKILENIRIKIETHIFDHIKGLTCSIGASLFVKDEDIEKTIKRADIQLYNAKEKGRNIVML